MSCSSVASIDDLAEAARVIGRDAQHLPRRRQARPLSGKPRVGAVDVSVEQPALADLELGDAVEVDASAFAVAFEERPHATSASAQRSVAPRPSPRELRTKWSSWAAVVVGRPDGQVEARLGEQHPVTHRGHAALARLGRRGPRRRPYGRARRA